MFFSKAINSIIRNIALQDRAREPGLARLVNMVEEEIMMSGSRADIGDKSYFFLMSSLVEKFHDFLSELVVSLGPDATSFS